MNKIFAYYLRLLHDSRRWIRFAAMVFVSGLIMGALSGMFHVQAILDILDTLVEDLAELGDQAISVGILERIFIIWQNNLQVAGLVIFGGFLLGYIPFSALFTNGLLLGLVGFLTVEQQANIWLLLLSIVPHGIIEFPVIIWAGATGMRLGWKWLRAPARGKRKKVLNDTVIESVAVFAACAVLLLVAAAIEGGLVFELLK